MVSQYFLPRSLAVTCTVVFLRAKLSKNFSLTQACLTFLGLSVAQLLAALVFLLWISPSLSRLKDIPTAPQPPLRNRLFKEPNAFHLEKWLETVPNQGIIRYFGFLNMERLLLASPEAVREVLHAKPYDYEKQYSQKTYIHRITGPGLVVVEGKTHKFHRKEMLPAFKYGRVRSYNPIFWTKANELVQCISQQISPAKDAQTDQVSVRDEQPRVMEVDDYIHRGVFDIIGLACFGLDFKSISQPQGLYRKLHDYRVAFEPSPGNKLRLLLSFVFPSWLVDALPIRFNRFTAKSINDVRALGRQIIAGKRKEMLKGDLEAKASPPDVLDSIMLSGHFSDAELLDNFMTLQSGGHHTTAAAVMSALWFLAQPQNINKQQTLRKEIRSKISASSFEPGSNVDFDVFESMPYLRAVCNEVLRLHSAFSWYGRKPIKETQICGYDLPAGVSLSISPWAMQRSTAIWGADALEFKPERWIDDISGRGGAERPYSWITFGGGPRSCIGEAFAKAELNCLLCSIFGRLEVEFPENTLPPRVTQQATVAFKEALKVKVTDLGAIW